MQRRVSAIFIFIFFVIIPSEVPAQSCSVGGASGSYGSVDILSGASVDTSTNFTVTCSGCFNVLGCAMNVCTQFNQGSNAGTPSSNSSTRYMGSGSNTTQHELYSDSNRTQIWGSWGYGTTAYGSGGVSTNLTVPFFGSASRTFTVYGRFKANQQTAVPSALYSWTTTSPSLAATSYAFSSPNCASDPGGYSSGGTSTWTATIAANCILSTTALNFGTASLLTSNIDALGAISVTCTNSTPYSLSLDNGANANGSQRRMRLSATSNFISYNLYTDAARTSAWSTTTSTTSCTSGAATCVLGTGIASAQNVSVYGRVPAQTSPAVGSYTDTVVVTLTF